MAGQTRGESTRERILSATEALVLSRGFTGTSIDEILKVTGLTKGAFFHHFRSKAELGQATLARWVERDFELLQQLSDRADALAEEPLQRALLFIRLIEESFENLAEPFPGCMLASYVYENEQFEGDVNKYVEESFRRWMRFYEDKFAAVFDVREPRVPVTARNLAEQMTCILEGSFIMARASSDRDVIVRQSRLFRRNLQLLFGEGPAVQTSASHV